MSSLLYTTPGLVPYLHSFALSATGRPVRFIHSAARSSNAEVPQTATRSIPHGMMNLLRLFAALLLTTCATPSVTASSISHLIIPTRPQLELRSESQLHPHFHSVIAEPRSSHLARRQATTAPPVSANSTDDTNPVHLACLNTLSTLASPESSTSLSACYNVPLLNSTSGVFRASLRLYKTAEPRENWLDVPLSDMVPAVDWDSAAGTMTRAPIKGAMTDSAKGPQFVVGYEWVARIDEDVLGKAMNLFVLPPSLYFMLVANRNRSTLQNILLPRVLITTPNRDSPLPPSRLTAAESSFLLGALSSSPLTTPPFVLPGTKIEILPIGLMVTGTWALLLAGAVGWGTMGRVRFRDHYRRRVTREKSRREGRRL